MKQAPLPVAIAQIASFGLVTGRMDARWGCAHMSICKVSMEILLVLPAKPWGTHPALLGCAGSFWRSAQWKVKPQRCTRLCSLCVHLEGDESNWASNLTLNIHCILDTNSKNSSPNILLFQSPNIKMTNFPKHTQQLVAKLPGNTPSSFKDNIIKRKTFWVIVPKKNTNPKKQTNKLFSPSHGCPI